MSGLAGTPTSLLVALTMLFGSTSAISDDLERAAQAAIDQALASPACAPTTGTIQACYNQIINDMPSWSAARSDASDRSESSAESRSKDKVTSAETGASGASPLQDALSRIIAAAGIPGLSEENGELVFGFNAPSEVFDEEAQLSVKATAKQPEAYQPLLEAFGDDVRAEKKAAFEDRLGELDDLELEVALSRLSERWGRNFSFHRSLFQGLWTEAGTARGLDTTPLEGFLATLNDLACPGIPEVQLFTSTFETIEGACPGAVVPEFMARLARSAAEAARSFGELTSIAEEKSVMEVADLVNNQPQLFLTLSYRDRDGMLTGPDQLSIRFKWEKGLRNVNGLRASCEDDGKDTPDLACTYAYLFCSKSDETDCSPDRNRARKARRIAFTAEYVDIDAYDFSPETGIDVMQDGSESLKAMFAYGWQLTTDEAGTGGSRVDIESMYEDVSNDPMRNDRLVGTATYSQKISAETTASLSLVWANKPEFLGEVDEQLSARIGFKWTVDSKNK